MEHKSKTKTKPTELTMARITINNYKNILKPKQKNDMGT